MIHLRHQANSQFTLCGSRVLATSGDQYADLNDGPIQLGAAYCSVCVAALSPVVVHLSAGKTQTGSNRAQCGVTGFAGYLASQFRAKVTCPGCLAPEKPMFGRFLP